MVSAAFLAFVIWAINEDLDSNNSDYDYDYDSYSNSLVVDVTR